MAKRVGLEIRAGTSGPVGKAWDRFAEQCLPDDCSAVQYTETRRAFYAGAIFTFSDITVRVTDKPEAEAMSELDKMSEEFGLWNSLIASGKV